MPFIETGFEGLFIFEPKVFEDSRGYFFEAFNGAIFNEMGLEDQFIQDNQSRSSYGVVRGLHYQKNPFAQVKLVRVIEGKILDIAVDIRVGSPTYGKSYSLELSSANKKQLYIPAGFAHGFSVLSETAIVLYKCNALYNKESEGGIFYNDPALAIDWAIPMDKAIISEKDKMLPMLNEIDNNFVC